MDLAQLARTARFTEARALSEEACVLLEESNALLRQVVLLQSHGERASSDTIYDLLQRRGRLYDEAIALFDKAQAMLR